MGEARTTREALIAQMLGELDELLIRAEQLPTTLVEAERRLAATTRSLDEAGDRYRQAVTTFTEEAKALLSDYLQHKAVETAACATNAQHTKLEEAVRQVLYAEAARHLDQSNARVKIATGPWGPLGVRLLEHGATAFLASVLTALLLSAAKFI